MISSAIHGWSARRLPTAPTAVRNAENGGPAGGRAVTAIENPRPSLPRPLTSPCHCRLRFLISCPVRAPAGPPKYVFQTAGPRSKLCYFTTFRSHEQSAGCGAHGINDCQVVQPPLCLSPACVGGTPRPRAGCCHIRAQSTSRRCCGSPGSSRRAAGACWPQRPGSSAW